MRMLSRRPPLHAAPPSEALEPQAAKCLAASLAMLCDRAFLFSFSISLLSPFLSLCVFVSFFLFLSVSLFFFFSLSLFQPRTPASWCKCCFPSTPSNKHCVVLHKGSIFVVVSVARICGLTASTVVDLVVRAGLQGVAVDGLVNVGGVAVDGLVSANIFVGKSNVLAVHGTDAASKLQQKTTMKSHHVVRHRTKHRDAVATACD